ncbi:MAG TPA: hypothetical protein VHO68_09135 [Bacteroidales bacterium]|nr:hypothetical protein [Bacteroidales bacterium]
MICFLTGFAMGFIQVNKYPGAEITNGIIRAKLYLPDEQKGYYQGVRFDRSGNMPVLEYNGHTYFGQWFPAYDPKTHDAIMGPVEEFGSFDFNQKNPGENFLKVGVGMLVKPDNKVYTIRKLYKNVNPGKWTVKKHADHVLFLHELKDKDYAYHYEKDVILVKGKPELLLSHTLKNTGKTTIETTVYDHNFFMIDKQPVGPGIEISFPYEISGEGMGIGPDKYVIISGRKIFFRKNLEKDSTIYCSDLKGYGPDAKDYDIKIENTVTHAGVRITCDQPLVRLPFWSCNTTACPEPYIKIKAEPGSEVKWNIRYEFYTD